jgi:hypothetical protein
MGFHVLKTMCQIFQVLDHARPPVWNPGPKIEIPRPENHVLKCFRFRSWKPRVWKSRTQSWDPTPWKPYPKISQVLGLGDPECKLHDAKNWGSHVLKIMSKKFPGFGSWKPTPCTSQNWDLTSWKSCPRKFHVYVFVKCKQTPCGQKLRSHILKKPCAKTMGPWKPQVQTSRSPKLRSHVLITMP